MVVGVPIPEQHAAEGRSTQQAINTALRDASAQGVTGADTTPFLLERIRDLTGGASLQSNIELVMNNARVGAQLAVAVAARSEKSKL